MDWFNYLGLIFVAIIMIPNIIFAVKSRQTDVNNYHNRAVAICEQLGRYGCMFFMVFNIPYTWIGYYFSYAHIVYICINTALVLAYCAIWAVMWNRQGITRALLLSIIPSLVFAISGIIIASIPLVLCALIFALSHVTISVKNATTQANQAGDRKKMVITVTAIALSVVIFALAVFGGIIIYNRANLAKLEGMTAEQMIDYCCTSKNAKISMALIENGNVTYHTYGHGGEEENVLYDYEIGSISKTFVGLLCARAISQGKLSLTDSIAQYLGLGNEKYYPTIERLLTHTSGYKPYYFEGSMIANKFAHISNDFYGISKDKILSTVKSTYLEDRDYPFAYSNFGISVMGLVLERIYGDNFINILNNYIANDLGLTDTEAAKQSSNLSGYWKWNHDDGYLPAGSIISNIEDMASYLNLYLSGDRDYISPTFNPIKEVNANTPAYENMNIRIDCVGMTWMIDNKNNVIWHNGGTTNFNSYIAFSKDRTRGVVILSNLSSNDKIPMTVIGAKILTNL